MRWLIVLAIVVAPAIAQDEQEERSGYEDGLVRESPAFALEGRFLRGERDAPAVFVRVKDAGVLQAKVGDAWEEGTLARLSELLSKTREDDDEAQKRIGKSGNEKLPGGRATRLFVSIDVDPAVPWEHVQWVATIAAEQRFAKLELVNGKSSLLVVLPVDGAICGPDDRPPLVLKAAVWVFARNEQPARWGDAEIRRPTQVRFRVGAAETGDLADVADYLRGMKETSEQTKPAYFYGEFKAGNTAPFGSVFDAMEAFVNAGIPSLDTSETFLFSIPSLSVRKAKRLPYPRKPHDPTGPPDPASED